MNEIKEGAKAITEIQTGARSSPFDLVSISRKSDYDKASLPIQVGVWQNGEIKPVTSSLLSSFWPRMISLAADCHEQNVRICRWQHGTVVLQATRPIATGQKLFLWFGEDLLVNDLAIPPYLNPTNIRGGNSYVCHICENEFVAPNPLKIHLALECGTLSIDVLWTRLSTIKKTSCRNLMLTPASTFPFTIRAPFCIPPQVPMPSPSQELRTLISPQSSNNNHPSIAESKSLTEQQAHLESIVSNMGKAKNGHVCLYCGKLYSRKYGLKIHIRTHTGYKPLQCRICHRPFGDPSNLNKHVRLHSDGNTPYRCEFCGKVLVRRRDLERHIRSRHSNSNNVTPNVALDCSVRNHGHNSTITSTSATLSGPTV